MSERRYSNDPKMPLHSVDAASAGGDVFVKRLADGTRTGVEFLYHTLDLLAETGLVEVETEDILAREELLEA